MQESKVSLKYMVLLQGSQKRNWRERERERAPQQMCVVLSHSVKSDSSRSHGLNSQGSSVHVDFPGKNTGVG